MPDDGAILGGRSQGKERMNRQWFCRGALLLLAAPAALLASACGSDRTFFIRACLVESASNSCSVAADAEEPALSQGAFDPSFANDYACPLLVGNTSEPPIEVTGADVRILREDGKPFPTGGTSGAPRTFSGPTSGFVETGTVAIPGLGVTRLRMLDVATANEVLAENSAGAVMISAVVLHGKTLDGEEVSTEEWLFPIRVLPPQSLCDMTPCFSGSQIGDPSYDNCHPGMDDKTDCRQGCPCTVGAGECAPLACIPLGKDPSKGLCQRCRLSEADCGPSAKCKPYDGSFDDTGLCL